jgi:hypothetical protein
MANPPLMKSSTAAVVTCDGTGWPYEPGGGGGIEP